MAKRDAEAQLTKDDYERGDGGDEENPSGEFKFASETVSATRPKRGLPKRLGGASPVVVAASPPPPTPPTNGTSETKPANPGFTGFGGFSGFAAPVPATSSTSTFGGFGGFGGFGTASTASGFGTTSKAPLFGGVNTNTATTNTSPFSAPSSSASLSAAPSLPKEQKAPPPAATINEDAVERYKKLRGLNHSLLEHLKSATEKDPFVDLTKTLSTALDAYKHHRETIPSRTGSSSTADSSPKTLSVPPPPPKPLSMPLPPAVPFAFGTGNSSPFSVSSNTASSSTAPAKAWAPLFPPLPTTAQKTDVKDASSALSYPSLTELKKPVSSPSTAFDFESKKDFGGSPLAPPPSSSSSSSTATPSLPFSLGLGGSKPFGSSGFSTSGSGGVPTGSSLFSFAPMASTPSSSATTNVTESSPPKTPSYSARTPGTPVAFGSATPKTPGGGGFFGSAFGRTSPGSGSLGNPVGFSFGTPSMKDKEAAAAAVVVAPPPAAATIAPLATTSFLAPPTQSSNATSREVSPLSTTETNDTTTDDRRPEDIQGAGEEDEIALCAIRAVVYAWKGKKWANFGAAMCKVKENKETGRHRLLCRQDTTNKVTVNFAIYNGFEPKPDGAKVVAFTGHEDGEGVPFKLRCGDADKAGELLRALKDAAAAL